MYFWTVGETEISEQADKPTIICTIFPEYDWICEILGEKKEEYEVKLLLENGVDIHSYQPTAKDIAEISDCDLFVYTGGVSENWIEETLESATNKNMQVLKLMEVLGEHVKTDIISIMTKQEITLTTTRGLSTCKSPPLWHPPNVLISTPIGMCSICAPLPVEKAHNWRTN